MIKLIASLLALLALSGCATTTRSDTMTATTATRSANEQQQLIDLSRQKWLWMASRDIAQLETLFHPSARFVHMGATMDKAAELDVIRTGRIEYKQADISEISTELLGDTAIVYSRLRLIAVVGGNEVSNPFSVTETYVRQGDRWQLAAMSFIRLLGD
jgi:4-carboxymuconolactone decarboxylase